MGPQQKRSHDEAEPSLLEGIKALIFDIEGTTTPVSFVKNELFPYIKENIESYLTNGYEDEETAKDVALLRDESKKDKEAGVKGVVVIPVATDSNKAEVIEACVANVKWQMDQDRKGTALKQLQGHMWREAYNEGKVMGELYEDVAPVLQQLAEEDFLLYIYSSGSVESQKLLFANSTDGDLTEILNGFFDTTIGSKTESESYKKITEEIGVEASEILFLTDNVEEAKAATQAGLTALIVDREENDLPEEARKNYRVINSFNELFDDEEDEEEYKRLTTGDNGEFEEEEEDLGEEEGEGDDDDLEEGEEEDEGEGEEEEGDDE
ncbi:hypothetical protein ACJMK2_036048 [Sinanodonta woodiana]|uniref:Enolase-phosphatase E1 n=1 Tax=Sinanodonta woodiana TaxID=1069815 RepID=A0ABD3WG75_SINWO